MTFWLKANILNAWPSATQVQILHRGNRPQHHRSVEGDGDEVDEEGDEVDEEGGEVWDGQEGESEVRETRESGTEGTEEARCVPEGGSHQAEGGEIEEEEREAEHGHRCQDAQVDDEGPREAAEEDPHRRARREHDLLEHERSGIHQWNCAEFEQEGIREREREGVQEHVDGGAREFRVVDLG